MKKILLLIYFMSISIIFGEESTLVKEEDKIGLVLSGGGAKGFAHIGLLKVLDEEKVPLDYITGTSMGSIIGALYAMGYSGEEIEKIILSRDWLSYFDDSIKREQELIENKNDKDKYAITIPIEDWKITLPKGAVKGQSADKVLEELYLNAKDINDFLKLPIPFACVATDAETGKPVVFTKGYLPDAIRASMSLPGLLEPVEYEGKLLLDGGLANNFPVTVALDLGADFIIGSEVLGDLDSKEKLNSAVMIMNQAIAYKRVDVTKNEKEKVDIFIFPNTEQYNIFSFQNAKEIIEIGEKTAREKIDEFKKLSNEEKFNEIRKNKVKEIDKFCIENIEIEGLKKYDLDTMLKIIGLNLPAKLTIDELSQLVDKVYNLRFFSKVDYKIIGTTLKIGVEERADKEIKVGFNYNNATKGDLFLKLTDKESDFTKGRLDLELLLGKDETAKVQNTWYIGPINKFGISLSANYSNVENYSLVSEGVKISNYDINLLNFDLMLGTFLSNTQIIGAGVKREFFNADLNVVNSETLDLEKYKSNYTLLYLKYIMDTLDDKYFPNNGLYVEGNFNFIQEKNEDIDFSNYKVKFNKALKLNEKLSLNFGAEKNYIGEENLLPLYMPTLGGVYSRQNSTTFWGLNPSDYLSDRIISGFSEMYYEFKPYRYIVLRYNQAHLSTNILNSTKDIYGGGIGLGVKTPVGPVQFILSKSNKRDLVGYLNVGYNF